MEKSKAIILTHSPDPKRICTAAARISTTHGSAIQIYDKSKKNDKGQLISKVLSLGHKSFIEHVWFTIAFENVSAFIEQFIIEFRLASFTIKSRRYVDFSNMGSYCPHFRFNTHKRSREKNKIIEEYLKHMDNLFNTYNDFVQNGIPKEDARFILPYSYRSNFYCTVNARELMHIIHSAVSGRGKRFPEVRSLGESLLKQAKAILPEVFELQEKVETGTEDKEFRLKKILAGVPKQGINEKEVTELLSYSHKPEETTAISAIIENTGCDTEKAKKIITEDRKLFNQVLQIVTEEKRKRELEQVNFTFRINRISLASLTHIVRHRMQSIIVPSFTEFGKSYSHITPETIMRKEAYLSKYIGVWDENRAVYETFKKAGVVEEDLVYLYLSGNLLDIITTMNGRELYHFLQLRTCNRAQWEIRIIAMDMLKKLIIVAPLLFSKVGPACFMTGKCPEGKLSCGKINEVKQIFNQNLLDKPV